MIVVEPIALTGAHVQLLPMQPDQAEALWRAAQDQSIWQWTLSRISSRADADQYIAYALKQQTLGNQLAFVTVSRATREIVGSTRFDMIAPEHRRVEIGWTWLTPRWQRTALNTEAKYLMLRHAFEVWGCVRVQLQTDALNVRSQRAIERLGAVREGVLRSYYILPDGRRRDSVYYSFLDSEWAAVKAHIERLLSAYGGG